MKLATCIAALVAAAVAYPAAATTLVFNSSNFAPITISSTTTGTGLTSTYTFDTTGNPGVWTISGILSTTQLVDANGKVQSDLDINSIFFDSKPFSNLTGTNDVTETRQLLSTLLTPAPHTLTINYDVDAADANNAAVLTGYLQIAQVNSSAVPEPATWAMFLGGFGLIGMGLRKRRPTVNRMMLTA